MNGWSALDRFLQTDPRDVGCAEAMDLLHVYAELTAANASAAERYPGIAAHLRACGPCGEDFDGLLAAVRGAAEFADGADGAAVLSVTPLEQVLGSCLEALGAEQLETEGVGEPAGRVERGRPERGGMRCLTSWTSPLTSTTMTVAARSGLSWMRPGIPAR